MTIKERQYISKVLGNALENVRGNVNHLSQDKRYTALLNLNSQSHGKVSSKVWLQVISVNNYFHIQNSNDFCNEIKNEIANGADKKYLKYVDYVKKLGTKYFAPEFEGGLRNAISMMCQSIVIYLFNGNKIFNRTKKEYQSQLKAMFRCYKKKATKQGAWGCQNQWWSIAPIQYENDVEHPKSFFDVFGVLNVFCQKVPHLCNLLNDWMDVNYCLSAFAHKKHDKRIAFVRKGVLNTYNNGYEVDNNKQKPTGSESAKRRYSTKQFSKDCAKTYDNMKKLEREYDNDNDNNKQTKPTKKNSDKANKQNPKHHHTHHVVQQSLF